MTPAVRWLRMRVLLALVTCVLAWAQPPAEAVSGRVTSAGRAIPGATVQVRQGEQRWSTLTDDEGRFHIESVLAGAVTIEVRMFAFQPLTREMEPAQRSAPLNLTLALAPPRSSMPRPMR